MAYYRSGGKIRHNHTNCQCAARVLRKRAGVSCTHFITRKQLQPISAGMKDSCPMYLTACCLAVLFHVVGYYSWLMRA